jgi:hypothetical protein
LSVSNLEASSPLLEGGVRGGIYLLLSSLYQGEGLLRPALSSLSIEGTAG